MKVSILLHAMFWRMFCIRTTSTSFMEHLRNTFCYVSTKVNYSEFVTPKKSIRDPTIWIYAIVSSEVLQQFWCWWICLSYVNEFPIVLFFIEKYLKKFILHFFSPFLWLFPGCELYLFFLKSLLISEPFSKSSPVSLAFL